MYHGELSQKRQHEVSTKERGPSNVETPDGRLSIRVQPCLHLVDLGEDVYRTVGTSRAVALATTAPTLEIARERVMQSAASVNVLQWRRDVGDDGYLNGLSELVAGAPAPAEAA